MQVRATSPAPFIVCYEIGGDPLGGPSREYNLWFFGYERRIWLRREAYLSNDEMADGGEVGTTSYPHDGYRHESTITARMIEETPDWLPHEVNPPVSAQKSLALARQNLDKTIPKKFDGFRVELQGATLRPLYRHKWYWDVEFFWRPDPQWR